MRMMVLLLLSWLFVVPVAAQTTPPTDPDHAKIVDALVPEIEGVHKYVGQVNTEVKKALTKLEALTTQLNTLAAQQTTLAAQVGTVKTQVTTVNTAVTALAGQVTTLDGKVGALDTKVTGLEGDMLALPVEIAAEGVGSQMISAVYYVYSHASSNSQRWKRSWHMPIVAGVTARPETFAPSGQAPHGSSSFGTTFPAGYIDTFSFSAGGGPTPNDDCDITITVRDDGEDTALSGTITDYDEDTNVSYSDPDSIDIDAGSLMNLYVQFSDACHYGKYNESPDYLAVSMNFTAAAVVGATD